MNTTTFNADLARMNATLEEMGALIVCEDGFVAVDPSKAPAVMLGAYGRLMSYGYANGLI